MTGKRSSAETSDFHTALVGASTPAYGASKAALNALTRSLAAELTEEGVTADAELRASVDTAL